MLAYVFLKGATMTWITTSDGPWQVTVTLEIHGNTSTAARLEGSTVVDVIDGFANFTDLRISHDGLFSLRYQVTKPSSANDKVANTYIFSLSKRKLKAHIEKNVDLVTPNKMFTLTAGIEDAVTGERISNIGWRVGFKMIIIA